MMRLLLAVVLACVLVCRVQGAVIANCQLYATDTDGNIVYYDLSHLQTEGGASYEMELNNEEYLVYAQICGTDRSSDECSSDQGSVCFYENNANGTYMGAMAGWDLDPDPSFSMLDSSNPDAGVVLTFNNGHYLNPADIVTVAITMPCDPDKDEPSLTAAITSNMNFSEFYIELEGSVIACPTDQPYIPGGNPSGDDSWSAGDYFLVTLALSSFFYLSVGMVYKSTQLGTSGIESVPNIDMWRNLPSLVAEGATFTVSKIRSVFQGKTETYDEL
jgi:hypothetical protein